MSHTERGIDLRPGAINMVADGEAACVKRDDPCLVELARASSSIRETIEALTAERNNARRQALMGCKEADELRAENRVLRSLLKKE